MKTINQRISTSFLWLIIITLLMIMLLFNFAMRIYSQAMAQRELRNAVATVEVVIRQQVSVDAQNQIGNETMLEKLKLIRETLKVSRIYSSTEFFIVDSSGKLHFPQNYSDSFLSARIVEKAVETLENKESGQVYSFRLAGTKYFVINNYSTGNSLLDYKLIFISSSSVFFGIVRVINIILMSIIALAIVVGSLVAVRLSKSITRPIADLSKHAKEIGRGNFLMLPANESSVEINDLTDNMNEMTKKLIDYDRTQKKFLQNASHEIRNPLMSIQGYAEGIAKGVFPDTAKTAEIICEESKRLNALVEGLLTLSRIESNTYEREFSMINLSDLLKEFVQNITGYALKENKSLELEIKDSSLTVYASDSLLSATVINIISNCIKYARSKINVSLFKKGEFAVIRINDDGEGFSQNDLAHVFDRFYRGKNGNFGLGLSIAKSAVDLMGGSIKAYNQNGAVFEIELPIWHD